MRGYALTLGGPGLAQTGVVDVIATDDESIAVATVHDEGIVARLIDRTRFKGDVVSADETHTGTPPSEVEASDDPAGAVNSHQ